MVATLSNSAISSRTPNEVAGFSPFDLAGENFYDTESADHAVGFFRDLLKHVKGPKAGQPLLLQPWQEAATRMIFGWKRPDGTRRFRRVYCEVPRKNGKSTWLAGLIAYCFFCDPQSEQGGELYSAAATAEQAGLVFGMVSAMIERHPALKARAKISKSVRRINRQSHGVISNTFYRAIPAETAQTHGFNASMIAADELHAWVGREFYDTLQTSTGSRQNPLSIDITTAGYDRESICWLQHEYARHVRDGEIKDDAFLPLLYSSEEKDDWTDPAVWAKANPNLGISVSEDYIARECKRAQESKTYENTFRRLHLNQWTQQATRFVPMAQWRAAARPYSEQELYGGECYGGLDLSHRYDITAWVMVFVAEGEYRLLARLFIPAGAADRIEHSDRMPYRQWAKEGHVILTPGDSIDYEFVHGHIVDDAQRFVIKQIGYDPWNAEATRQALEAKGLTCVEMRQGARTLSAPLKELERALIAGELVHNNNECLNWQAENLEVRSDPNGNIQPVKPRHNAHRLKIDGMVAATMAIGLAQLRPEAQEFDSSMFQVIDLDGLKG